MEGGCFGGGGGGYGGHMEMYTKQISEKSTTMKIGIANPLEYIRWRGGVVRMGKGRTCTASSIKL
jgi:hypothetical protein